VRTHSAVTIRLRIDPIACDGFGHCAELAPELLGLDEWGYPILVEGDDHVPGEVPARLAGIARAAVAQCPRRALALERARRS